MTLFEYERFYYDDNYNGYIVDDSICKEKLEKAKNQNKNIAFPLEKNRKECIEKIREAIDLLQKNGIDLTKIKIGIYFNHHKESYLTADELTEIVKVEELVNNYGGNFVIIAEDDFSLSEVINANAKLDSQVNYINSLRVPDEGNRPLNQFEKFLMAYNYCTDREYKENNNDKFASRNLTSILNGDAIVCVGYAKLLKELCSRLGINCFEAGCKVFDKKYKEIEDHANNIVCLDGKLYYADACWDSYEEKYKNEKLYNYCLMPIADKDNLTKFDITYDQNTVFRDLNLERKLINELLIKVKNSDKELRLTDEELQLTIKYLERMPDIDKIIKEKLSNVNGFSERSRLRQIYKIQAVKELLNKYEYGEGFSYDDFYWAIYNIKRAEGYNIEQSKKYANKIMLSNKNRAKEIFTENASNCFVDMKKRECES